MKKTLVAFLLVLASFGFTAQVIATDTQVDEPVIQEIQLTDEALEILEAGAKVVKVLPGNGGYYVLFDDGSWQWVAE